MSKYLITPSYALAFGLIWAASSPLAAQENQTREIAVDLKFESELLAELGPAAVTQAEMDASLAEIPAEHRANFMLDRRRLASRLDQLLFTRLMADDAREQGFLSDNPDIQARLHEALLASLVRLWRDHRHSLVDVDFEALAREQYLADPDQFRAPPEVGFDHVLITTEERSDLEALRLLLELHAQVEEGTDFETIIDAHSEDDLQPEGGYRDVAVDSLDPAFGAALTDAPVSDRLLGPVRTQYGWHLVRLIERRGGEVLDWEEAREQAVVNVRASHFERVEARYRARLLEGHELQMPEGAIEELYERYDLLQFFEQVD